MSGSSSDSTTPPQGAQPAAAPRAMPRVAADASSLDEALRRLPPYTRSLLRVRVPISVTLASTKQSVRRILELGPGAIIQFRKTCEETLTLEVAGRPIAEGEAVKVGDKFVLWITSMILPKERFEKITGRAKDVIKKPQ